MVLNFAFFLFAIVFAFPVFLFPQSTWTDYHSCLVIFVLVGMVVMAGRPRKHKALIKNRRATVYKTILLLALASAFEIYMLTEVGGLNGLFSRDVVLEDSKNFNTSSSEFFGSQFNYLLIAVGAWLFSSSLAKNKLMHFALATLVSSYLLASTGTRWHWLLAISPVLIFSLNRLKPWEKLILTALGVLSGLLVSSMRSTAETLTLAVSALWDIPSFESFRVIEFVTPEFKDMVNFVYGQIFVLIPRFIWADKPLDMATTDYMTSVIGDAFYRGATVLPGFFGSAWLYGGFVSLFIFSVSLLYSLRKVDGYIHTNSSGFDLGFAALVGIGLLLQIRGISIFYLIPALYYYILFVRLPNFACGAVIKKRAPSL